MKLTCAQMDILISFYLDKELSPVLRKQVEEHLAECSSCQTKYEIIKSMFGELKEILETNETSPVAQPLSECYSTNMHSEQYKTFKENLSAYIDNELSNEENIKIKKFTINNKNARKELEDSYSIKKLLSDSFKKSKENAKNDFSRSILKQMELQEEASLNFHPAIKLLIIFTLSVLILTTIVLLSLSL